MPWWLWLGALLILMMIEATFFVIRYENLIWDIRTGPQPLPFRSGMKLIWVETDRNDVTEEVPGVRVEQ